MLLALANWSIFIWKSTCNFHHLCTTEHQGFAVVAQHAFVIRAQYPLPCCQDCVISNQTQVTNPMVRKAHCVEVSTARKSQTTGLSAKHAGGCTFLTSLLMLELLHCTYVKNIAKNKNCLSKMASCSDLRNNYPYPGCAGHRPSTSWCKLGTHGFPLCCCIYE